MWILYVAIGFKFVGLFVYLGIVCRSEKKMYDREQFRKLNEIIKIKFELKYPDWEKMFSNFHKQMSVFAVQANAINFNLIKAFQPIMKQYSDDVHAFVERVSESPRIISVDHEVSYIRDGVTTSLPGIEGFVIDRKNDRDDGS